MEFSHVPTEISISGVYFPPIMFAVILAICVAKFLVHLMDRFDLTRFVWHPPLFFVSLTALCTWFVSVFIFPV